MQDLPTQARKKSRGTTDSHGAGSKKIAKAEREAADTENA